MVERKRTVQVAQMSDGDYLVLNDTKEYLPSGTVIEPEVFSTLARMALVTIVADWQLTSEEREILRSRSLDVA